MSNTKQIRYGYGVTLICPHHSETKFLGTQVFCIELRKGSIITVEGVLFSVERVDNEDGFLDVVPIVMEDLFP